MHIKCILKVVAQVFGDKVAVLYPLSLKTPHLVPLKWVQKPLIQPSFFSHLTDMNTNHLHNYSLGLQKDHQL